MTTLFEKHSKRDCTCSYCDEPRYFLFGLRLPQCRAWNAWRVIYLVGLKNVYYLRWTRPSLKNMTSLNKRDRDTDDAMALIGLTIVTTIIAFLSYILITA